MPAVTPDQARDFYRAATSTRPLGHSFSLKIPSPSAAGGVDGQQFLGEVRRRGVTSRRFPAEAPQAKAIQGGWERRSDVGW